MTYKMNNQYFDKCKDVQFKYKSINIKIFLQLSITQIHYSVRLSPVAEPLNTK